MIRVHTTNRRTVSVWPCQGSAWPVRLDLPTVVYHFYWCSGGSYPVFCPTPKIPLSVDVTPLLRLRRNTSPGASEDGCRHALELRRRDGSVFGDLRIPGSVVERLSGLGLGGFRGWCSLILRWLQITKFSDSKSQLIIHLYLLIVWSTS